MEGIEAGAIQLELKYCERCGGLWLRPRGSELVFCAACARVMAGLAPNTRFLITAPTAVPGGEETAFWTEGGNA